MPAIFTQLFILTINGLFEFNSWLQLFFPFCMNLDVQMSCNKLEEVGIWHLAQGKHL